MTPDEQNWRLFTYTFTLVAVALAVTLIHSCESAIQRADRAVEVCLKAGGVPEPTSNDTVACRGIK